MDEQGVATTEGDGAALDLSGMVCPHVLARVAAAVDARPDSDLDFISDHPTSVNITVPAYCESRGLELQTLWVQGGAHHMRIRRVPANIVPGKVQA